MTEFSLLPYSASLRKEWDALVDGSKNATFLLRRDYMDYHADRFTDASFIVERKGKPLCAFAASIAGHTVTAHGGLTYGGFILPSSGLDGAAAVEILGLILDEYRRRGVKTLIYKPIPPIYHSMPAEEDIYALFRHGAALTACGLSSAINMANPAGYNENMRRNMKKAVAQGVVVGPDKAVGEFVALLSEVLASRHNTRPVHTAEELQLLQSRFPDEIALFSARNARGEMIAGVVVYFTGNVAHAQYIAASDEGRNVGALPLLFSYILSSSGRDFSYFDFGISTEQGGRYLNEGLHHQKYSLGGRGIVYPVYTIEL